MYLVQEQCRICFATFEMQEAIWSNCCVRDTISEMDLSEELRNNIPSATQTPYTRSGVRVGFGGKGVRYRGEVGGFGVEELGFRV